MLIQFFVLILLMFSTLITSLVPLETSTFDHLLSSNINISRSTSAETTVNDDQSNLCPKTCSTDYCLPYASKNKNCTKFIRDQCDCCTVCLRDENEICGGGLRDIYGICDEPLLCYRTNETGICVKGMKWSVCLWRAQSSDTSDDVFLACLKYQCLNVSHSSNQSTCQCAYRRIPCDTRLQNNETSSICDEKQIEAVSYLKSSDDGKKIDRSWRRPY